MDFAFIFPGQGSQTLKMMDGFNEVNIVKNTFKIAQEILNIDFLAMLQEETADSINQTVNTQPLILTASYAIYLSYLEKSNKLPKIMAGHSLGEWSALVASGVIKFEDALKLVKLRAEFMQNAVAPGEGSMAAVLGLDNETVVSICNQVSENLSQIVAGVNFNSPGQVVIAGNRSAVDSASVILKEKGAKKVQPLAMSVPSHCALLHSASERLALAIAKIEFNLPSIPVIHNYNVKNFSDPNLIKDALVKQLYSPVFWTDTIKQIVDLGIINIVECGPGKVLSGLNKRIDSNIISYNLSTKSDLTNTITQLN